MNAAHPALFVDKEGSRKSDKGIQGGQRTGDPLFIRQSTEDLVIFYVILIPHPGKYLPYIFGVCLSFILDGDNFYAPLMVDIIPGSQKRGLVDTVRAPGTPDGDDHYLVLKLLIGQGDPAPRQIREGEIE